MKELLQLPLSYYLLAIIMGGMVTLGLFIDNYYSTAFSQDLEEIERKTEGLKTNYQHFSNSE